MIFLKIFAGAIASLAAAIFFYNLLIAWMMKRARAKCERNPHTGILRGAEPVYLEVPGRTACLLIHGFIGSPTDWGKIPKRLHEAGYSVYVPLLPGHGTDPRDFSKVSADDLIRTVSYAYSNLKKKYNRVVLAGLSMGGALSLLAAADQKVDALILLAPYLRIKHQAWYLFPAEGYHRVLAPFIPYIYRLPCFRQIFRREALSGMIDYDFISTRGVSALFEINRRVREADISKWNSPLLVIHSRKDKAVDYQASVELCRRLERENIRFVTLERSNHIITRDYEAAEVEREMLEFLAGIADA